MTKASSAAKRAVANLARTNLALGTRNPKPYNFAMPNLLVNGGEILWIIIFAGAAGIVVFIERALHCHRAQINSTEFLNGVRNEQPICRVIDANVADVVDPVPGVNEARQVVAGDADACIEDGGSR